MAFWDDIYKAIFNPPGTGVMAPKNPATNPFEEAARAGAAVGAYQGTGGSLMDKINAATKATETPAPVPPGEAVKKLVPTLLSPGGDLRTVAVWVVIALVGLIGLWGLIAPGGGVAIIERARR